MSARNSLLLFISIVLTLISVRSQQINTTIGNVTVPSTQPTTNPTTNSTTTTNTTNTATVSSINSLQTTKLTNTSTAATVLNTTQTQSPINTTRKNTFYIPYYIPKNKLGKFFTALCRNEKTLI
jgi:ABC-type bacteriocin/lantibiotic exporter with double-glycine peptidase domain